MTKRTINIH